MLKNSKPTRYKSGKLLNAFALTMMPPELPCSWSGNFSRTPAILKKHDSRASEFCF